MPTYLVKPPPYELRMAFMDALEESGIDYSREAEGYLLYLKDGQLSMWERISESCRAEVLEEDPPMLFG